MTCPKNRERCTLCGFCTKKANEEQKLILGKAKAYDLLVEPLTELIFKYKEDDSLGSYEKHLYGIIKSILSDDGSKSK